jgi:hypothetical protein
LFCSKELFIDKHLKCSLQGKTLCQLFHPYCTDKHFFLLQKHDSIDLKISVGLPYRLESKD